MENNIHAATEPGDNSEAVNPETNPSDAGSKIIAHNTGLFNISADKTSENPGTRHETSQDTQQWLASGLRPFAYTPIASSNHKAVEGESSNPDLPCGSSLQSKDQQSTAVVPPTNSIRNPLRPTQTTGENMRPGILNTQLDSSMAGPSQVATNIFTTESGPHWYDVRNKLVTPRVMSKRLPEAFNSLPIQGQPNSGEKLEDYQKKKMREFIGFNLNDLEFQKLSALCSPNNAKTGLELEMSDPIPMLALSQTERDRIDAYNADHSDSNLNIVKKQQHREQTDGDKQNYLKKLKYRGQRLAPLYHQKMEASTSTEGSVVEDQLQPGRDLLFFIRIYRPYFYDNNRRARSGQPQHGRHSVFSRDAVVCGRLPIHTLRKMFTCPNDVDTRHDVAKTPQIVPSFEAGQELFPSGFMFINNVFYVDDRDGCKDISAVIREWAVKRGKGTFQKQSMAVKFQDIPLRLCHPEVYVHQGNCEHIFIISEVRLVTTSDPLNVSHYPCNTSLSQNQLVYCTTCGEFSTSWIVTNCKRVAFDPAFFCDTCLKLYLYVDGVPVEDFKLFSYNCNSNDPIIPKNNDE